MKTPRVIALSVAFVSCSLYLPAQRMGMDSSLPPQSQSPFPNQSAIPGANPGMSTGRNDNRSITGAVQDNQNNGLNDVQVELTDASGSTVGSSYTNSSGHFEFDR